MTFLAENFALLRDAFLTTLALAVVSGLCALVLGTAPGRHAREPRARRCGAPPPSTWRCSGTPR